jgi:GntR family transcriptional regulator
VYLCLNTLMALVFSILPASEVPIHRQIAQHIRLALVQERLQLGDQLPPVRVLAEELVVNPNTVARAYQELIREGLLESRSGVGVFVIEKQQVFSSAERERRLKEAMRPALLEALILDFSLPETQATLESMWRDLQNPRRKKP